MNCDEIYRAPGLRGRAHEALTSEARVVSQVDSKGWLFRVDIVPKQRQHRLLVPFCGTLELAKDHAVTVDQEARRQALHHEFVERRRFRIEINGEVLDTEPLKERIDHLGAAAILRDRENLELVAKPCLKPVERRHLFNAGHAP